jgi:hypothetical protein
VNSPSPWDIHDLREQGDLLRYLHQARARAAVECQQRRRQILAHPDLAARVVDILQLTAPEHWNGYVAPEQDCTGAPNRSPLRAALVEVVAEAEQREAS